MKDQDWRNSLSMHLSFKRTKDKNGGEKINRKREPSRDNVLRNKGKSFTSYLKNIWKKLTKKCDFG